MTAPEVTMLWEATDPVATLRERFGFASPDEAATWVKATVADRWGIAVRRCEKLVLSAGNGLGWLATDAGPLLAKWTVSPQLHERLAELARLVGWLHDRGLPVSPPLPALDGSAQVALRAASIGLQEVRAGDWLDPADSEQVAHAGETLAQLQLAMADYPRAHLVGAPVYDRNTGPLPARVNRQLEGCSPSETKTLLLRCLGHLPELPDGTRQLAHRDIRAANLLCTARRVTSILDFEEAAPDYAVAELAKAAVLLGTRFRNWAPIGPERHRLFLDGYQRVRCLSSSERAWLPVLMAGLSLQFAGKGPDTVGWGASARHLAAWSNVGGIEEGIH